MRNWRNNEDGRQVGEKAQKVAVSGRHVVRRLGQEAFLSFFSTNGADREMAVNLIIRPERADYCK